MTDFFDFIQVLGQITSKETNFDSFDQCLITGSSYVSKQKKKIIKKAIITPDLNKTVIVEALKNKVDLILIYYFEKEEKSLLIDENLDIFKHIIENNIIIYKIPDSWAYCKGGLNETIAEILKLEIENVFQIKMGENFLPYGRVCSPFKSQIRYSLLLNLISDKLNLKNFQYCLVNNINDNVQKCLILAGKNAKPEWLKRAKMRGIDLFLGNGLDYFLARFAESIKINFFDLSNKSIYIGLAKLSKILALECPETEFIMIESPMPLLFFSR